MFVIANEKLLYPGKVGTAADNYVCGIIYYFIFLNNTFESEEEIIFNVNADVITNNGKSIVANGSVNCS